MKSLNEHIKKHEVKEVLKHPRLKMLDEFHRRINAERQALDMRALPISAIGVKTAHLSIEDMAYLLKKCQQSSNFSRTFFGLLKTKNNKNA